MFYVQGIQGRVFSGPLERLDRVNGLARSRPDRAIAGEDEELGVAAAPVTDIRRIAAVMLDKGVDGVPVVSEAGRIMGIVSRGDILRAVVTDPPLSLWR
jgi:acetoin utilization protein AcuB